MKIMVFLHGTSIMHKTALGKKRSERVSQVKEKDESVLEYEKYIPVGNVVSKLNSWIKQGADIVYLSSHEENVDVERDKFVLNRYNFPQGEVLYRKNGEGYKSVAERVMPDILIEDDCESIGGEKEMTYTFIAPELKKKIKSIPVKEFGGIDHLPDDLNNLKDYS
jgi:hypothetical protein